MNKLPKSQQCNMFAGEYFKQEAARQAQIELADELRKQNEIQKESNKLIREQIEFLKSVNKEQEKALKKEQKWSKIAWAITTAIAIASTIAQFIPSLG